MARKRRKTVWGAGELNLTAMIDVAFQLLNFFLITSHPVDVMSRLSVLRPKPDYTATRETQLEALVIMVLPEKYIINKTPVDFEQLEGILGKLAIRSKNQSVLIECLNQTHHKQLVRLLDLCAQLGLKNMSLVSSGGA